MDNRLVLLVDDSPLIVRMLSSYLGHKGFNIMAATDGLEAIEKAYRELPDIILLDIMMPRMNGYQVCRLLKNDEQVKHIPVVMFTSKDKELEKFWGLQTGADAYVTKDISYDNLLAVISEQLGMADKRRYRDRKPIEPITLTDILVKTNDLLDRKLYEVTVVNRIISLARDIRAYKEIIDKVLVILSGLISCQTSAFGISDSNSLRFFVRSAVQLHADDLRALEVFFLSQLGRPDGSMPMRTESVILGPDGYGLGRTISDPTRLFTFQSSQNESQNDWRGFAFYGDTPRTLSSHERAVTELILEQALVVIENAYLYEGIRLKSITDELTGLYNRRHFFERLIDEYRRMSRYDGAEFVLLLMDIDYFKSVNDTYGHMVGDEFLRSLARILTSCIRSTDVAARFGGEEFVVLLPHSTLEGGASFAERLRKAVESHEFHASGQRVPVTVSVGVSGTQKGWDRGVDDVIGNADSALYKAKEGGRNRIYVYEGP